MTEQELIQEFRNSANCWADSEDAIQAMDEEKAIEFAKAYAAAQVAAKDVEIDRLQTALNRTVKQATEVIDEIAALKANEERLREGIRKLGVLGREIVTKIDDFKETPYQVAKPIHELSKALLSPADGSIDTKDSGTHRLVTTLGDYLNHRGVSIEAVKEQYSMLFPADGDGVDAGRGIEG